MCLAQDIFNWCIVKRLGLEKVQNAANLDWGHIHCYAIFNLQCLAY